jgi:hypothetical protein
MTGIEKRFEGELKEIKETYAHKDMIETHIKQITNIMQDMKVEQHRMSQRMDEFVKWLMQLQVNREKT